MGGRVGCFTGVEGSDNVVGRVVSARLEVAGHQLELPEAPHHCLWDQQTQGRDTVNTLLMAFFSSSSDSCCVLYTVEFFLMTEKPTVMGLNGVLYAEQQSEGTL